MANRTVKDADTIKGTNPQYLVEKIIRSRVYDSKYWKENCFALTAELLVDKVLLLNLSYCIAIYFWYPLAMMYPYITQFKFRLWSFATPVECLVETSSPPPSSASY